MERYTATAYTNNHITALNDGSDLWQLTTVLLLHLNESSSGSYGIIIDNNRGVIVQRFCKSVIED